MNVSLSTDGMAGAAPLVQPTFVLAKFCPDVMRNEPRNVGVILQMPSGSVWARFLGDGRGDRLNGSQPPWLRASTGYPEWHTYWRRALREGVKTAGGIVLPSSPEFLAALCARSKNSFRLGDRGAVLERVAEAAAGELLHFLFATLVATPQSEEAVRAGEALPAGDEAEMERRQRWLAQELRTYRLGRDRLKLGRLRRVEGGDLSDGSGALADSEDRHYRLAVNGTGAFGWQVEHVVMSGPILLPDADLMTLVPFARSLLAAYELANHAYALQAIEELQLAAGEAAAAAVDLEVEAAAAAPCPHGQAEASVCDACLLAGDLASDAARERRSAR